MACDAQTLISTAYANGYAKLSERDLEECIVASACAGGGGGGGSSSLTCGVGDPVAVPASGCANYIDTASGRIWWYYNGAWQ